MKKYYFKDGDDRKGPFTKEELVNFSLSLDTLIWYDGLDSWKPLRNISDLNNIVKPLLPKNLQLKDDNKNKSKKILYSTITFLVLLSVSIIIVSITIESKKSKFKQELSYRIESIFNGKIVISDGENYAVRGSSIKVEKPIKSDSERLNPLCKVLYEKHEKEGVVEEYFLQEGGFIFKTLKKDEFGFVLEVITPSTMEIYKTKYLQEKIQETYNIAYKRIVQEYSNSFIEGVYASISNFDSLENEYYNIDNTVKPSDPYSSNWKSKGNYVLNDFGKVFWNAEYWYYEISPKNSVIEEDYLKYISLCILFSALLSFLILAVNPFKW